MLKYKEKFVEECSSQYLSNFIFEMLFSCTKIKAESKKKYNYVRKQLNIYKTKQNLLLLKKRLAICMKVLGQSENL